jgi:hypothetical protein
VSYLLQYARRSSQAARVDERLKLNHPEFDGGASVRVYVEDTTATRRAPHLALRISDCDEEIELEFGVHTPELRANSLYKIDTLLGALSRFRDGLAAEIALYESRL